jgi:hypothetical protein
MHNGIPRDRDLSSKHVSLKYWCISISQSNVRLYTYVSVDEGKLMVRYLTLSLTDPFLGNDRETDNRATADSQQATVELQQQKNSWKRCFLLDPCKRL